MSGRERMLELIRKLPEEFEEALSFDYPDIKGDFERIIIGGMGGSGVGGALLKSYIQNVPIEVIQGYNLPDYVKKNPEKTLFIAVSYSGNTEETISLYKEASLIGLCRIGISSGGKLKELCAKDKVPFIEIPGGFPPRTALGYLFTSILKIFQKIGFVKNIDEDIKKLSKFLKSLQKEFEDAEGLAFEMAYKYYLRVPIICTSDRFYPIAFRWKTQINENAKSYAISTFIPEFCHNEIVGLDNPHNIVIEFWMTFLKTSFENERNILRMQILTDLLNRSVMGINIIEAKGSNLLEEIFYLVYLGDYISYYLSTLYEVDPIKIERIDLLKEELKGR